MLVYKYHQDDTETHIFKLLTVKFINVFFLSQMTPNAIGSRCVVTNRGAEYALIKMNF